MGRATRLVPAVVAVLLMLAPAAVAGGDSTTSTTAPVTTTTAPATTTTTLPGPCGAVLGAGARWITRTAPCEASLLLGRTVTITLPSRMRWGPLSSTSRAVLAVTSAHPDTGGLTGTLRGRVRGTARVSAIGAPVCPSGLACPEYVMLWTLRVKVVAPAPRTASVTVTRAQDGSTVTLSKGQRLVVGLAGSSAYAWTTPVAANAAVLARTSGSAGHAVFDAVGAGTTTVSAVDNPDCYPACLPPSELFSVHVVVR